MTGMTTSDEQHRRLWTTQLKVLGVMFMTIGGVIATFLVVVALMGVLSYFGIDKDAATQSPSDAVVVVFSLVVPASLLLQTGFGLYRTRRSARMLAIITAAVLLVGLNVMLLFFHGESQETGRAFQVFHGLMIAIGVYSVILLAPEKVTRYLN